MTTLTLTPPTAERTVSKQEWLETTLYDLLAALNAAAGPEDEEVVLATMVHLLQTSRITCTHGGTTYRLVCEEADSLCRL
jgi:hypothetical protein